MNHRDADQNIFRLEGGLLPADLFNQLAALQLPGQSAAEYRIPQGLTLRDEIGRYWRIAQANWQNFDQQRQRTDLSDPTGAAQHWLHSLLTEVFGFTDLQAYSTPQVIDERGFPITHHACNGRVPMVFCAPAEKALDTADPRFGHEGRKRSPTGLLQEYLNANDQALWGLVSDGQRLRILRDNPSMTRPAYVEVDLATCFAEEQLPAFRILWLMLHASRFQPRDHEGAADVHLCWLELWRAQAEEQGERLLDKLRVGVTVALGALGSGFLRHPQNDTLRQQFTDRELDAQAYYQELLRLVYRLLFLLRAEARDLLHPEGSDPLAKERYREGYSLDTLRRAARKPHRFEARHHDLWLTLQHSLQGLAKGQPLLALPALGGLFDNSQCPHLDQSLIDNQALLKAIKALTWHPSDSSNTLVATDYANMDAEELGSVYEALLELVPAIDQNPWRFSFIGLEAGENTAGNLRKLTGSYYTPDVLVQSLIDTALKPVVRERLAENPASPRQALLDMRVVDPACGSGHFLLAATRTLAREVAQLDAEGSEPTPAQFQHALRDVVQHCIYGVDLNPMAIELCRAALWMEALEPGKPLTFLDSHIQCGNALVGVYDPAVLEKGIPDDAFKALEGDDKALLKDLKKTNKQQAQTLAIDLRINAQQLAAVEELPEESLDEVLNKRQQWQAAQQSQEARRARLLEDLWTAAFFVPKNQGYANRIPDNGALKAAHRGELSPEVAAEVRLRAEQNRFFHWPLQFPEVFNRDNAGFDVVLGNPPWEELQSSDTEFFAARDQQIANMLGDTRKKAIDELKVSNLNLYNEYILEKRALDATKNFIRVSDRFPLTAHGKLNLYPLFSELALTLLNQSGRSGIVVQRGIATDDSNKFFFQYITEKKMLSSFLDIENSEGMFQSVHRSFNFCLLTLAHNVESAELLFYAKNKNDLENPSRRIHLEPDDFLRINPNTLTAPTFRADKDAEITRKIYRRVPVFLREREPERNPWNVSFKQGLFNMTSASHLFRTYEQLDEKGAQLVGNQFQLDGTRYLPLYEAKMVHHYDHRFATYETDGETTRDTTVAEKQQTDYAPLPRYWVEEREVLLRTADMPRVVLDGLKKQDTAKLEEGLRQWLAGQLLIREQFEEASQLLGSRVTKRGTTGNLFQTAEFTKDGLAARKMAEDHPMTDAELDDWLTAFSARQDYAMLVEGRLEGRSPKYLLGFRDICRATDERTFIGSTIPFTAVGNKYPLMLLPVATPSDQAAALQANLATLPFDYIARQKIGGTTMNFFIAKQLPVLPPETYKETDLAYITPRVLELTYTSHELAPFARDLGYDGEPFGWDPDRRHQLRCELDAYYARLYGLTREELRYILDPAEVMGPDYPSVTFPGLKRKEIAEYGEYLTQRRVLEAFDALQGQ
ncbi:restriction endonuclease [Marinobacterium iners]|uniref:Eco57I restriction-modification methylase domain-containing protein n=1 Tax=Marinobacterium iners TaxID=48076 RepID=UPI001A8E966A|nr:N-6 DNA methylase [Marinobacterium iners]QSR35237.1 restriction endonuclease [Marinobacterium iners]